MDIQHPDITYMEKYGELPESYWEREERRWDEWDESFEADDDE